MEASQDKDEVRFPLGYEHLEDKARQLSESIKDREGQIERILAGKDGPIQELKPAGGPRRMPRDQVVALMKRQMEADKEALMREVEKATEHDGKTGARVRDLTVSMIHKNPFQEMTREELDQHRDDVKDLNTSQDYARTHLPKDLRRTPGAPSREASPGNKERERFNDKDGPER